MEIIKESTSMEIIKEPTSFSVNVSCPYCNAILKVEEEDIFMNQIPIPETGGIGYTCNYNCPCCNHSNFISYSDCCNGQSYMEMRKRRLNGLSEHFDNGGKVFKFFVRHG